jgi:putative addiction module component (TIGR02574 family)
MMTIDEIKAELTKLSDEQREEVMDFLAGSFSGEENQLDDEWLEEIDRRVAQADLDRTQEIPAEEVHREMREKYS